MEPPNNTLVQHCIPVIWTLSFVVTTASVMQCMPRQAPKESQRRLEPGAGSDFLIKVELLSLRLAQKLNGPVKRVAVTYILNEEGKADELGDRIAELLSTWLANAAQTSSFTVVDHRALKAIIKNRKFESQPIFERRKQLRKRFGADAIVIGKYRDLGLGGEISLNLRAIDVDTGEMVASDEMVIRRNADDEPPQRRQPEHDPSNQARAQPDTPNSSGSADTKNQSDSSNRHIRTRTSYRPMVQDILVRQQPAPKTGLLLEMRLHNELAEPVAVLFEWMGFHSSWRAVTAIDDQSRRFVSTECNIKETSRSYWNYEYIMTQGVKIAPGSTRTIECDLMITSRSKPSSCIRRLELRMALAYTDKNGRQKHEDWRQEKSSIPVMNSDGTSTSDACRSD